MLCEQRELVVPDRLNLVHPRAEVAEWRLDKPVDPHARVGTLVLLLDEPVGAQHLEVPADGGGSHRESGCHRARPLRAFAKKFDDRTSRWVGESEEDAVDTDSHGNNI